LANTSEIKFQVVELIQTPFLFEVGGVGKFNCSKKYTFHKK